MNRIHPHSLGLALGIFLALFHAIWSVLVFLGIAQSMMDTILNLHMIVPFITIADFSLVNAVLLVIVTGIIGYVFGWLLGVIWNRYAVK